MKCYMLAMLIQGQPVSLSADNLTLYVPAVEANEMVQMRIIQVIQRTKNKVSGTYVVMGDTAIVISYKDQEKIKQVYIYGSNNKNKNFS